VIGPLAGRAAAGAEVLIVEGVMGLFDGASDDGTTGSTAHVARLLEAPVVLVVDGSSLSTSVAALVHGYRTFDPKLAIAGVILNRVGSDGHETLLREAVALTGVPVLGALRRDDTLTWRDRHLGLVPVIERPADVERSLHRLAAAISARVDLDAVLDVARSAPATEVAVPPAARPSGRARVAVAGGPAFSFGYADNFELLTQAGAELVPFDPLTADGLPDGTDAMVAGGGFPEIYVEALAGNRRLNADVAARVRAGMPTWAECGGMLWLARTLDGHPQCGAIATDGRMTGKLSLGYRRARLCTDTPIGAAGTELRGHEFHYSTVDPTGDALELEGRFGKGRAGFASPTLLASYLHLHLGATPEVAEHFVATASRSML
jgi:cobyrinic acid a,c-diamide synthase